MRGNFGAHAYLIICTAGKYIIIARTAVLVVYAVASCFAIADPFIETSASISLFIGGATVPGSLTRTDISHLAHFAVSLHIPSQKSIGLPAASPFQSPEPPCSASLKGTCMFSCGLIMPDFLLHRMFCAVIASSWT